MDKFKNLIIPNSAMDLCYKFANSCLHYLKKDKENFSNFNRTDEILFLTTFIFILMIFLIISFYSIVYVPLQFNKKFNNNNIAFIIAIAIGFIAFPFVNVVAFAVVVHKFIKSKR